MQDRDMIALIEAIYNPKPRRTWNGKPAPRPKRNQKEVESTARCFLSALRASVESGEYRLYRSKPGNKIQMDDSILGYFTDDCITIINGRAIGIYAAAIGSNDLVSVVASRLWPDMVAAGIRCNKSNRRWAGRYYEVRKLYRADIDRLMPGWKLGEES